MLHKIEMFNSYLMTDLDFGKINVTFSLWPLKNLYITRFMVNFKFVFPSFYPFLQAKLSGIF